jgi:Uma2 family endonuclease
MATIDTLLTAEEFFELPDDGRPTELVKGRVITMNMPGGRHGWLCNRLGRMIGNFVDDHKLGYVFNNDSGVITGRSPDTVRGADVAYYSHMRMPHGPPTRYPEQPPELVIEVRSPDDRWKETLAKVADYLNAGVLVVCVVDPQSETVKTYYPDRPEETLGMNGELRFPEILPGFMVSVRSIFE